MLHSLETDTPNVLEEYEVIDTATHSIYIRCFECGYVFTAEVIGEEFRDGTLKDNKDGTWTSCILPEGLCTKCSGIEE